MSNDDFKKLIGDVQSLKPRNQSKEFSHQAKATPRSTIRQTGKCLPDTTISENDYFLKPEDPLEFRQQGVQTSVLKSLARGEYKPLISIDLHNMTTGDAEGYMNATINAVKRPYLSCIKIIHGKGYHQTEGASHAFPALKNFVYHFLKQHPRVLAFASTPTRHGGTGAVYVLIRKTTK